MKNTLIFLIFMIFFSGCQFVPLFSPIITGIIIWKEGQAQKYYEINTSIMYRCVKNSLHDLNIKITKDQKNKNGYYLQAENKDTFYIHIYYVKKDVSNVAIRINTFGNKSYTELIYQKIDSNMDIINYDNKGLPVKIESHYLY